MAIVTLEAETINQIYSKLQSMANGDCHTPGGPLSYATLGDFPMRLWAIVRHDSGQLSDATLGNCPTRR